jgi:hypothetical protein
VPSAAEQQHWRIIRWLLRTSFCWAWCCWHQRQQPPLPNPLQRRSVAGSSHPNRAATTTVVAGSLHAMSPLRVTGPQSHSTPSLVSDQPVSSAQNTGKCKGIQYMPEGRGGCRCMHADDRSLDNVYYYYYCLLALCIHVHAPPPAALRALLFDISHHLIR